MSEPRIRPTVEWLALLAWLDRLAVLGVAWAGEAAGELRDYLGIRPPRAATYGLFQFNTRPARPSSGCDPAVNATAAARVLRDAR